MLSKRLLRWVQRRMDVHDDWTDHRWAETHRPVETHVCWDYPECAWVRCIVCGKEKIDHAGVDEIR